MTQLCIFFPINKSLYMCNSPEIQYNIEIQLFELHNIYLNKGDIKMQLNQHPAQSTFVGLS